MTDYRNVLFIMLIVAMALCTAGCVAQESDKGLAIAGKNKIISGNTEWHPDPQPVISPELKNFRRYYIMGVDKIDPQYIIIRSISYEDQDINNKSLVIKIKGGKKDVKTHFFFIRDHTPSLDKSNGVGVSNTAVIPANEEMEIFFSIPTAVNAADFYELEITDLSH